MFKVEVQINDFYLPEKGIKCVTGCKVLKLKSNIVIVTMNLIQVKIDEKIAFPEAPEILSKNLKKNIEFDFYRISNDTFPPEKKHSKE